jgi:FlaA1/EpsC-like NDP-sugar epimerase
VGTGDEAERLLRELHHHGEPRLRIMGLLSGEPGGRGRSLRGIRVIGEIDELVTLVARHRIEFVIIALDAPGGELTQRVVTACVDAGVEFKSLPTIQDLLVSRSRSDGLRSVRVQDLLSREPVRLDPERIGATIRGKVVLVTGGAGSIGSELGRQISRLGPKELILLDQAESALYFMVLELAETHPGLRVVPVVCDITDARNVMRVFERWRPQYVIHAAAYKHVPMMEDNVIEAVRNNVFGTMHLASAAATWGAERFVLISTDKAVRPSSVMGATKRVAERLVLGLPRFIRSSLDFRAVRFGNVLGSAGSVVPLFERQVTERKPITVTHPDVERYFMTITEAAQLVLEAGAIDEASGRITMLEMGQPVRILDLAERLIRLAGLEPYRDVPIVFTGLRPGEKLREQLSSELEASVSTIVEKIRIVQGKETDGTSLAATLGQLGSAVAVGDATKVLDCLCDLVPECVPPLRNRRSGKHAVEADRHAVEVDLHGEGTLQPMLLDSRTAAAS